MESKLYYAKTCAEQKWGKRELREQINRKAFERVGIANTQLAKSATKTYRRSIILHA